MRGLINIAITIVVKVMLVQERIIICKVFRTRKDQHKSPVPGWILQTNNSIIQLD